MKRSLLPEMQQSSIWRTLACRNTACAGRTVSRDAGDLPEAKQHLEESLRMKRSLHGDRDHPDTAAYPGIAVHCMAGQ